MSYFMYTTLLRWKENSGIAKLHGQCVMLTEVPPWPSGTLLGINYIPESGRRKLCLAAERRWRDMTDEEMLLAQAAIRELVVP